MVTSTSTPRPVPLAKIPMEVWRVASVITIGSFMSTLSSSLVNVGLKTIGQDLGAPLSQAQWVAAGYLIAFAAFLPSGPVLPIIGGLATPDTAPRGVAGPPP